MSIVALNPDMFVADKVEENILFRYRLTDPNTGQSWTVDVTEDEASNVEASALCNACSSGLNKHDKRGQETWHQCTCDVDGLIIDLLDI